MYTCDLFTRACGAWEDPKVERESGLEIYDFFSGPGASENERWPFVRVKWRKAVYVVHGEDEMQG